MATGNLQKLVLFAYNDREQTSVRTDLGVGLQSSRILQTLLRPNCGDQVHSMKAWLSLFDPLVSEGTSNHLPVFSRNGWRTWIVSIFALVFTCGDQTIHKRRIQNVCILRMRKKALGALRMRGDWVHKDPTDERKINCRLWLIRSQ